jgi:Zn-dependent protease
VRSSLRIVSVRGIPIRVHASFLLLPAFLLWQTGGHPSLSVIVIETTLLVLLFASVALHELGHALVARRWEMETRSIVLYPFGGVSNFACRPPGGRAELAISLAGPAVNLALAVALWLIAAAGGLPPRVDEVIRGLAWINLLIAAFNLLPAFPLDGGRVLRGALSERLGEARATVWAASAGQVTAVVLVGVGIFHEPWLALAGVVLLPAANLELRAALRRRELDRTTVMAVVPQRPLRVDAADTFEEVGTRWRSNPMADVVVGSGTSLAWIPAARMWHDTGRGDRSTRIGDIAEPVELRLAADTPLAEAQRVLQARHAEAAAVIDDHDNVVGVLTNDRLRRALALRDSLESARFGPFAAGPPSDDAASEDEPDPPQPPR